LSLATGSAVAFTGFRLRINISIIKRCKRRLTSSDLGIGVFRGDITFQPQTDYLARINVVGTAVSLGLRNWRSFT
jgi:hypothetical protein